MDYNLNSIYCYVHWWNINKIIIMILYCHAHDKLVILIIYSVTVDIIRLILIIIIVLLVINSSILIHRSICNTLNMLNHH